MSDANYQKKLNPNDRRTSYGDVRPLLRAILIGVILAAALMVAAAMADPEPDLAFSLKSSAERALQVTKNESSIGSEIRNWFRQL